MRTCPPLLGRTIVIAIRRKLKEVQNKVDIVGLMQKEKFKIEEVEEL